MAVKVGYTVLGATLLSIYSYSGPAWGGSEAPQDEEDPYRTEPEELTITALRRPTALRTTAASVEAYDRDRLTLYSVFDAQRLSDLSPGLMLPILPGGYFAPSIRGIGTPTNSAFSESSVVTQVDGLALGRPAALQGQLYDLERVEVVKGPQGVRYGRNALGGAINVLTRQPDADAFSASADLQVGDFNQRLTDAAINVPLGAATALRVAGHAVDREGFYNDGTSDDDLVAGRVSFLTWLTDAVSLAVGGDYATQGGKSEGAALLDFGKVPFEPWRGLPDTVPIPAIFPPSIGFALPTQLYRDNTFAGARAELQWQSAIGTLTTTSGWRSTRTDMLTTAPGNFLGTQADADQSSVEVRYASPQEQRWNYVAGVTYFGEQINGRDWTDQGPRGVTRQDYATDTASYSAYGEFGYAVNDTVRVTAGGRFIFEERTADMQAALFDRFVPPATPAVLRQNARLLDNASTESSGVTWSLGVEWQASEQTFAYASAGSGFKGGGFSQAGTAFDSESVTGVEAGLRHWSQEQQMQFSGAAFYMSYDDQQVSFDRRVGTGSPALVVPTTDNLGQIRVQGFDLGVDWLMSPELTVRVGASYVDAKYDELRFVTPILGAFPPPYSCPFEPDNGIYRIDCSGRRTLHTPDVAINFSIEYHTLVSNDSQIVVMLGAHSDSPRETHISYSETRVESSTRMDLSATYYAPRWYIGGYVLDTNENNVVDTVTPHSAFPQVQAHTATLQTPRFYALRFGYRSR